MSQHRHISPPEVKCEGGAAVMALLAMVFGLGVIVGAVIW